MNTPKDSFGRSSNDALSLPALKGDVSRAKTMIVLSAKKVLIGGSRTAQCGVFISFKSPDNILSQYVSIELDGVNKYFEITEVSTSSERGDLEYTAIEAGYREDKVSSDENIDIRDIIHYDINIVPESKTSEIRTRSAYC